MQQRVPVGGWRSLAHLGNNYEFSIWEAKSMSCCSLPALQIGPNLLLVSEITRSRNRFVAGTRTPTFRSNCGTQFPHVCEILNVKIKLYFFLQRREGKV